MQKSGLGTRVAIRMDATPFTINIDNNDCNYGTGSHVVMTRNMKRARRNFILVLPRTVISAKRLLIVLLLNKSTE